MVIPGELSPHSPIMLDRLQKKFLDHLLMLGVESQWAPVAVRCAVRQLSGTTPPLLSLSELKESILIKEHKQLWN